MFWFGFGLAVLTLMFMGLVYWRFMAYGGTASYLAPGDTSDSRARSEPPKHMVQVLIPYFIGAFGGIACGYISATGADTRQKRAHDPATKNAGT